MAGAPNKALNRTKGQSGQDLPSAGLRSPPARTATRPTAPQKSRWQMTGLPGLHSHLRQVLGLPPTGSVCLENPAGTAPEPTLSPATGICATWQVAGTYLLIGGHLPWSGLSPTVAMSHGPQDVAPEHRVLTLGPTGRGEWLQRRRLCLRRRSRVKSCPWAPSLGWGTGPACGSDGARGWARGPSIVVRTAAGRQ